MSDVDRFLVPPPREPIVPAPPPDFSVIIPAYEARETICEAVDSALAQTYPAKDVVVCDDGSKDGLADALAPYEDRIVLVRHPQNRGLSTTRNTAISRATGEFIVNLDADDVLLPGNLAARAELLAERPDLDIVCTQGEVEVDGVVMRRIYNDEWAFEVEDQRGTILERNFVTQWSARRARLLEVGGFDESLANAEDWDIAIRLILTGSLAGLVTEPLASYRLQWGSLSNQVISLASNRIKTMEKALQTGYLTDEERRGLQALIEAEETDLALARVSEALLDREPHARRKAWRIATAGAMPPGTRLRAALAAVAPGIARRMLTRRGRQTAAGLTLPVD